VNAWKRWKRRRSNDRLKMAKSLVAESCNGSTRRGVESTSALKEVFSNGRPFIAVSTTKVNQVQLASSFYQVVTWIYVSERNTDYLHGIDVLCFLN